MKNSLPTYIEAIKALEKEDYETVAEAIFPFELEDVTYIERVTAAVRTLLLRPDIAAKQIVSIGRAVHALERLPLRTAGIDVDIALSYKNEDGGESYELILKSERFATESGGYIRGDYGSDTFSGMTFAVESGCRLYEGWLSATESWPDVFSKMTSSELKIENYSDDELMDWDHTDGSAFWSWIEENYD